MWRWLTRVVPDLSEKDFGLLLKHFDKDKHDLSELDHCT